MIERDALERKRYWIWLSLIQGLGSIKKQQLLKKYKTPEKIYCTNIEELLKVEGIGDILANAILDNNTKRVVDKHIEYLWKNQIDIISIVDKEYPEILKEIYDYPISLYIKGNKEILRDRSIAIVGCREASDYGKKAAKYFAYNLARKGINIISGLARGVDSYSHIGAICSKKEDKYPHNKSYPQFNTKNVVDNFEQKINCGKTIAVLGNGLDTIYPTENIELAKYIIKSGGAIITEYPLGTKPEKMNFPARNRIVSGLCKGVLVIEAKEKSGSLITVDYALEQGRDVYVVPGNINSINSVGTNNLIKQGAQLVTNFNEILYSTF